MMKLILKCTFLILMSFLLMSCGGGGGTGKSGSEASSRLKESEVTKAIAELNNKKLDSQTLNESLSSLLDN